MRSCVFFEKVQSTSAQFVIVARDIDRVTVNAQAPLKSAMFWHRTLSQR